MFITLSLIMPHNFLFKDFGSLELYDRNPLGLIELGLDNLGQCNLVEIRIPKKFLSVSL